MPLGLDRLPVGESGKHKAKLTPEEWAEVHEAHARGVSYKTILEALPPEKKYANLNAFYQAIANQRTRRNGK